MAKRKHRRGNKPSPVLEHASGTITMAALRKVVESMSSGSPLPFPYMVTEAQKARFLAAGVPEHRLQVTKRIPEVGAQLYIQTVGRGLRPKPSPVPTVLHFGGRRVGKMERMRDQIAALGPDRPIEPLGAGLSRILSRGAPQPVRYPRGG